MTSKNTYWWGIAALVCLLIQIGCTFVFGENAKVQHLLHKQRQELSYLNRESISPYTLRSAAEIFRLTVPRQAPAFPVEELGRLPAWSELQTTLDAYAKRLQLLEDQSKEVDDYLQGRSYWIGKVGFVSSLCTSLLIIWWSIRLIVTRSRLPLRVPSN